MWQIIHNSFSITCMWSVEGLNVIAVLDVITFGPKFVFNQVEVPNVRGQQMDFNYANSKQQIYMKGS